MKQIKTVLLIIIVCAILALNLPVQNTVKATPGHCCVYLGDLRSSGGAPWADRQCDGTVYINHYPVVFQANCSFDEYLDNEYYSARYSITDTTTEYEVVNWRNCTGDSVMPAEEWTMELEYASKPETSMHVLEWAIDTKHGEDSRSCTVIFQDEES